jgi:hypothetical protein
MEGLTRQQLETLAQRLRPEDRERLRPDGALEPKLPPMCLCGGLEAPYLVVPASGPLGHPPAELGMADRLG